MMQRLLERISVSRYKNNFILKGGFLIAAMVGIDIRSTMDIDTTIKGISVNKEVIAGIVNEIIAIELEDNISFRLIDVKSIHDSSNSDDFRISIEAQFFSIRVKMKMDITTEDIIIPREVDFPYKIMFEDRNITIKAYNLNTILAEKIESILARNVLNTRARDYYDVYILFTLRKNDIDLESLRRAIRKKSEERNTVVYIDNNEKYLRDIEDSEELKIIWESYTRKFSYAKDIQFSEITKILGGIFRT